MKWYVKNADGKVFGPVDDEKLLAWVKDGRVEPFAGVSNDLKTWKLASLVPSLEMDWLIENEPGRFYGPTHRAVIDDLMKSDALAATCRIYRDDHGGQAEKEAAAARDEAERAMAEVQADAEKAMTELKNEAERTLSEKEAAIAALQKDLESFRTRAEESEARVAELESKLEKLTETRPREWQAEVLEPEVVSEAPPPMVREIFKPGRAQTLADLERQAQAELARMGAARAKKFFGIKK